jgi:hypothetical protein
LAYSWEKAEGFPNEIKISFDNYGKELKDIELLIAIPEYKVNLDTNKAPSQNDLFVLASIQNESLVIMIEGKVDEPFDKIIGEWNINDSPSRNQRLNFLTKKLEINLTPEINGLRYQMFHRAVSAILMAERFKTKKAIMLVQSFSEKNSWFDDYCNFISVISEQYNNKTLPRIGEIYKLTTLKTGIEFYVGWISSKKYGNS